MGGGVGAVTTLRTVLHERRDPTSAELEQLRRFPGWGATPELFDPTSTKYSAEREALQEVFSDEEWAAARRTVLNAHYTHPDYVRAMWASLSDLGVPVGAEILEPGCGTGNFIGAARSGDRVTGVELDPTSAGIAQLLHPSAVVKAESFMDTRLEGDGFDSVIGNVPFAAVKPYDPVYNPARLSLHNAFIVKSLRLTKPGGVVAVMSSRWTMDGKAERARREIAKYGELLGAVRMPAGAHGEIAGTEAIVDVLVFRRHLGETPVGDPDWVKTVEITGDAGTANLNRYFDEHPEQMLGNMGTRLGQFGPELTVTADDVSAAAVGPQLSAALARVVQHAKADGRGWDALDQVVTDRPVAAVRQNPDQIVGRVTRDESGNFQQVGASGIIDVKLPKNAVTEMGVLLELRDAATTLLEAEASTMDDTAELDELRADLNRIYDGYVAQFGPLGRFTTSVREREGKDPIVTRRFPAAIRALRQDPHFPTVVALERFNDDTGEARKATIFHERVVDVPKEVGRVDTPEDAIRVSLDRTGVVDVPLVAQLLDVEEAKVADRLGELVFLSPTTDGEYIPTEEYLSGNVRAKLAEARELAEDDERYLRHVVELEKVIPEEFGPAEIDVKLGAAWIPVKDMEEFIEVTFGKEVRAIERIAGEWQFKLVGKVEPRAEARWSVAGDHTGLKAEQVFKRVLNGEKLELRYTPDKDGPSFIDQVATEALQERATELHDEFQDWLWQDAERSTRLQSRYNDLYNGIVLRSYDNANLTFPGKARTFDPHPHQHAAVARMLAEPAVGLFHEVGAGKTAEMVLGVMELRRLGLAKKPAIVVPNQMLEQFTREFKQIYPRAQVLSAGSDDIAKVGNRDGRKQFVARARTGDWDAIIITHGAFSRIGIGEAQSAYAQQRLDEMREVLEQKLNYDSASSVKKLEKELASQQEKLKKLLDLDHDEGVTWDETGIDYLCIDEAHTFKNLTVASKVPDLSKARGSDRAQNLDMKLWFHREHLGQSRVATLATATPLPNSMIEMYVMMRYMRPDLLQEAEVYTADDWARQFTEQVTSVEPSVDGTYQVKTRTTKFRNLPELLRMWHVPGDVKTQADLKLDVPALSADENGRPGARMILVPPTAAQEAGMADLIERGELVRNRSVMPEEDNMLKITSNGRALALDARLLDGDSPGSVFENDERSKVDHLVDEVHRVWEENRDKEYLDEWGDPSPVKGGFQIVFADLGTPSDDGSWDAYNHIRNGLVGHGIPREKVRFIHEATNDKLKAELFQQCRDGRVSVLIGSTQKMGVGTNIQARAVALHHIDAPWRPADVTQREGRLVRQGNQNEEVEIYRYATEGSFDSYMWGTLARKAAFIEQVLAGRLDVREAENNSEMALEFAEMQAITAGDMRILEVANLKQETQKLHRQHKGHLRKISSIQAQRQVAEGVMRSLDHDVKALEEMAPNLVSTKGESFAGKVRSGRWAEAAVQRNRAEFGKALAHTLTSAIASRPLSTHNAFYPARVGVQVEVGGVVWDTQAKWNHKDHANPLIIFHAENVRDALTTEVALRTLQTGDEGSQSRRFEQRVNDMPKLIEDLTGQWKTKQAEVHAFVSMEKEPWPKSTELKEKQERLQALVLELENEARGPEQAATQTTPPPTQTTTQGIAQ